MRDDANTSPPTNKQNPSCFASFREHYTSPSPAVSIKFVREVITVASLRAQLDYQVSGTKPSSLNVEFLVQDCLIPSENDWCKAYVLQVQPEGLVDVRVLSGDGAGNIVKGVSVKRLRGRRRVTAAIKFFYATAMIALFMTFLLLIPLVAFPRFCPLMNSRQTSLTSALSPSVCNSSTNFSIRGSHLRRLPLECCAPTVEGNRAFNNWLSSSEKDVTKELKNPMCRLDPDILFRHVFFCAGGCRMQDSLTCCCQAMRTYRSILRLYSCDSWFWSVAGVLKCLWESFRTRLQAIWGRRSKPRARPSKAGCFSP